MWQFQFALLLVYLHRFQARNFETSPSPITLYDEPTLVSAMPAYQVFAPDDGNLNAFQELTFTDDMEFILIGEREKLHIVPVNNITNILDTETFSSKPNPTSGALSCSTIAKDIERQCRNYITVIQPIADNKFIVCGTNGFVPLCYNCTNDSITPDLICGNDSASFNFTAESGVASFEPLKEAVLSYVPSVAPFGDVVFAGGSEEMDQDSVISRAEIDNEGKIDLSTLIKTDKDNPDWLNDAAFIGDPIQYGDHVYLFFRETATEYINAGKIVYSRVGRVCKNDAGGSLGSVLDDKWTTFQKARLNCSTQGDIPFYYDELRDIYRSSNAETIFAVFTTPGLTKTISGSAVCVFRMDEIQQLFNEGKFKGQARVGQLWLPIDGSQVPTPRPGSCTQPHPSSSFQFIKKYPLMDELIPNTNNYRAVQDYTHGSNSPFVVIKNTKIVEVVVDEGVITADGTTYDVFFLASVDGFIYKLYKANENDIVIVDEYDLELDPNKEEILITMELRDKTLYIGTTERVLSIPVEHCTTSYKQCYSCVQTQDPYCSWKNGACQSGVTDGIQCLRDKATTKPYQCTVNCDDWPKPKIAIASQDVIHVPSKQTSIHMFFTATAPLNSDMDIAFACNCSDGSPCMESFTQTHSNGRMLASKVEWMSLSLTADSWTVECSPANIVFSATAYGGEPISVSRRVDVDMSGFDIEGKFRVTEEQVIDFDDQFAAYNYEVGLWERMVIEKCSDRSPTTCKAMPYR